MLDAEDGFNDIDRSIRVEDIPKKNRKGKPNIWREVAERFGPLVVVFISKRMGGEKLDVPSYSRLCAPALDRYCQED